MSEDYRGFANQAAVDECKNILVDTITEMFWILSRFVADDKLRRVPEFLMLVLKQAQLKNLFVINREALRGFIDTTLISTFLPVDTKKYACTGFLKASANVLASSWPVNTTDAISLNKDDYRQVERHGSKLNRVMSGPDDSDSMSGMLESRYIKDTSFLLSPSLSWRKIDMIDEHQQINPNIDIYGIHKRDKKRIKAKSLRALQSNFQRYNMIDTPEFYDSVLTIIKNYAVHLHTDDGAFIYTVVHMFHRKSELYSLLRVFLSLEKLQSQDLETKSQWLYSFIRHYMMTNIKPLHHLLAMRKCKQQESEPIQEYYTRFRHLASLNGQGDCQYSKYLFVTGLRSPALKLYADCFVDEPFERLLEEVEGAIIKNPEYYLKEPEDHSCKRNSFFHFC